MSSQPSNRFYADLPPNRDFQAITKAASFRDVPADWSVIIGDIVNSTQAVEQGRYKTVNLVGASVIAAAVNAYDETALAYVFGGDGATLLVPADALEPVCNALRGLQGRARAAFDLELRVGTVPLKDIRERGARVVIAKLELSPGNYIALFAGGGCALADALVKSPDSAGRYLIESSSDDEPDLTRLSCRWNKLASRRGATAAVLIDALGPSDKERGANLARALETITHTLGSLAERAPANRQSLRFRWPPQGARLEAQVLEGAVHATRLVRILYESALQRIAHAFGLKIGDYDAPLYAQEVAQNTDYLRFDDVIRLVLDCTVEEITALRAGLDGLEEKGAIRYGLHAAPAALMTCLLFDLANHAHVHFIDADEGGFTLAARELKAKPKP